MATTRPRKRNPALTEARRQQVLDAAAACFRRDGFRGASMAAISAEADMSTGHIYHYFPSKEAIVRAFVERDQQWGLASIEGLKQTGDVLQAMIDQSAECLVDRAEVSHPALSLEIAAEASRNPVIAAIMTECSATIRAALEDALAVGRDQGSIAATPDTAVLCTLMMIIFDGITVRSVLAPDFDREATLGGLRLLLERLLRPPRKADERIVDVRFDNDRLSVDLMDGRTISVPLAWYPRLFDATPDQRRHWLVAGGGYGIHWPDIDEDLSTEGLLGGAPAPRNVQRA